MRRPSTLGILLAAAGTIACAAASQRQPEPGGSSLLDDPLSCPEVTLIADGRARITVHASAEVLAPDKAVPPKPSAGHSRELLRRRLRESAKDLAHYLGAIAGAEVELVSGPPANSRPEEAPLPILLGQLGENRFGPMGKHAPQDQAFRIIVSPEAIGLYGESPLATSYAIYTLLDRLGCRWYMPGPLGEVIPRRKLVTATLGDWTQAPATHYRDIWYRDDAYARRNRLGGLNIIAGHALESYVTRDQRKAHPNWCALIDGTRDPRRSQLSWGNPEAAAAVADAVIRRLDDDYVPSISLSPSDTTVFGEGPEEQQLDTGDWDPTLRRISLTDRLLSFANKIAEQVSQSYPNVRLGLLAYVQYTRPPLREKPHPNIVIKLAPITYNRAHPMTDDRHPTSASLREVVAGWGHVTGGHFSCYPYAYNLGEVSAPFPMIQRWSHDLPAFFENGCRYFQPETLPNFETSLHGLYLGIRLAWDPSQDPDAILAELNHRFYGGAAPAMARYWNLIDRAWTETPEFSGNFWGYFQRFPPELLQEAEATLDEASGSAVNSVERRRVELASRSFEQFKLLMKLRRDLVDGSWNELRANTERWVQNHLALGKEYLDNYAFSVSTLRPGVSPGVRFFQRFLQPAYDSAARIYEQAEFVTSEPLRRFRFRPDPEGRGHTENWAAPKFDASDWQETDVGTETWATLGLYDYFGALWYRAIVDFGDPVIDKKTYLWIAGTAGSLEAFVNGRKVQAVRDDGSLAATFSDYARPVHFDLTPIKDLHGTVTISLRAEREKLDELGVGGVLGPAVVYREPR